MTKPYSFSFFKGVCLPLLLWIAFTPWSADFDLQASHYFFEDGHFLSNSFWDSLYQYGVWPAWLLVIFACIGFGLSFSNRYAFYRKPCLLLILTLVIGSGLIIHVGLKDHWGRPRPRQVTEFGGTQTFRPYYQPNFFHQPQPSKSFTCGHCSMGFYFFALALLGAIYRQHLLYWTGLALAWSLGILLSLARIAQGGHFLSDVLATALIMWLTAWGLAYFLFKYQRNHDERSDA